MLNAELASIRRSDPDVDAGDITLFTLPLVVRAAGIAVIGVVPRLVVRNGAVENSQLVPIIGSTALVIICAAVVAWLTAIVLPSGERSAPSAAGFASASLRSLTVGSG